MAWLRESHDLVFHRDHDYTSERDPAVMLAVDSIAPFRERFEVRKAYSESSTHRKFVGVEKFNVKGESPIRVPGAPAGSLKIMSFLMDRSPTKSVCWPRYLKSCPMACSVANKNKPECNMQSDTSNETKFWHPNFSRFRQYNGLEAFIPTSLFFWYQGMAPAVEGVRRWQRTTLKIVNTR